MTHLGERPGYGQGALPFSAIPPVLCPPFGILTYPDGRVDVIHRSAWNRSSAKFAKTEFYEVRIAPVHRP